MASVNLGAESKSRLPLRVLCVEDSRIEAYRVKAVLAQCSVTDFKLTHTTNLKAALHEVALQEHDVVLLDLNLPDSDGFETFFQVRSAAPDIPIVLFTAVDDEELAIHAVQYGADDYIKKSVALPEVLSRALRYAVERKQAALALQQGERGFRVLFESASAALIIFDDNGKVLKANAAATRILTEIGCSFAALLQHEPAPVMRDKLVQAGFAAGEWHVMRTGQQPLYLEYAATANYLPGKHLAEIRDITERMLLQRRISEAEKLELVSRIASGVAHDFNNLLMIIAGNTELIIGAMGEDHAFRKNAEQVLGTARRAAGLTKQLLALSKAHSADLAPVSLGTFLEDVRPMLSTLVGANIQVEIDSRASNCIVQADQVLLEQITFNLAINARDAMGPGGKFYVSVFPIQVDEAFADKCSALSPGPYARIEFRDTGTGIPESMQARIFEPFFTTKPKGTGLGLATVHNAVTRLGGTILVDSRLGEGTSFHVYLPRVGAPQHALEQYSLPLPDRQSGHTILVVDDEPSSRELIAQFLGDSGFRVLQAGGGEEAVRTFFEFQAEIRLILTDVLMPDMNGNELATRIRELHPDTAVLFMSGYGDDLLPPNVQSSRLLHKPFALTTLAEKVRYELESLTRAPAGPGTCLVCRSEKERGPAMTSTAVSVPREMGR
ncbi:MAG TPA: response regulator [Terriglobales bacterium]|nr:response regulator [Terriglobales bacterium]